MGEGVAWDELVGMRRLLASESGSPCVSRVKRPPSPFPTSQKRHTGGVEAGGQTRARGKIFGPYQGRIRSPQAQGDNTAAPSLTIPAA